ncbi:unnamed protein product [Brassica oleracea]|uniref:(rape) hypothetical protein n=1 Tax=Brassica napus TaxID=3708 RepID=A0A816J2H7_BRANA|nr:unnamed protein product [Brassica napus]
MMRESRSCKNEQQEERLDFTAELQGEMEHDYDNRCTGEVVDAYYLEMDNDDDEITDDDEDAKGGR